MVTAKKKTDSEIPEPAARVELLQGGRIVYADGKIVNRFDRRTTLLLLAYLALFQRRAHNREELCDLLWPDLSPASARNSLSVALSSLRSLLQGALHADRWEVRLNLMTDVRELERTRNPDLYAGPLLPGFDLPWLNLERLRLETLALQLLEARGTEADCRRLLTLDPTNETVLRHLLIRLRAEGRTGEMLSLYEPCVEALAELGLEPAAETRALMAELPRRARRRSAEPPRILPNWAAPFFGRQEEIGRIKEALASGARLITITGPGGMGKTRISTEFARLHTDRAVYFVPLAATMTASEAGEAILQRLNSPRQASVALWDQIQARLGRTSTLLILDNFEQLSAEAGCRLAELVEATPKLTCLVTSRRRLEVRGEQEVSLESLPTAHAVGLFLQRAQAMRATFAAEPELLERIVLLADRMPLALEMAAARALVLSAEEIEEGLSDRLAFLRARRVDIEDRHRSIEATLQWSWELLTPDLQSTLAALSVFRGGFTWKAAEAVCGQSAGTLEMLEALRANSLLAVSGDPPRFSLLETVRVFSQERLDATAIRSVGERHAAYYTGQLERGEPCREERENLRAASAWLADYGDPEAQLGFIAAFRRAHWEEGFSESIEHCRPAVALAEQPALPILLRGQALAAYALVTERVEQGSSETFRKAAALLEESGEDAPLHAFMLQYGGTQEHREQAERVARQAGDDRTLSWVLTIQGNNACYRGDWDCAERYWDEGMAAALRAGDDVRMGFVRCEASFYLARRGEYVRALALLQEIPELYRLGNWNYARLLMALGRYDLARSFAQHNAAHYDQLGAARLSVTCYSILATAHLCVGDHEAAHRVCVRAEKTAGAVQHRLRSEIALARGEVETALRNARTGLAQAPRAPNFHSGSDRVVLLEVLARAAACAGKSEEAWSALLEAMEVRFRFGVRQHQCENLETAAYLQAQAGQFAEAICSLYAAEEARRERSNPCLPYLRRFALEARQQLPSTLRDVECLSLDTAIQRLLK